MRRRALRGIRSDTKKVAMSDKGVSVHLSGGGYGAWNGGGGGERRKEGEGGEVFYENEV